MRDSRATWLAARREIREHSRSRAFRVSTILQMLGVIVIVVIASIGSGGGPAELPVGYVGAAGKSTVKMAESAQAALDLKIKPQGLSGRKAAHRAIAAGEIDAAVGDRAGLIASGISDEGEALIRQSVEATNLRSTLTRAGLSPAEVDRILNRPASISTVDSGEDESGAGIALISTLVLYLALIFGGYAVSSGVTEEKSSRVVELVINAIRPRNLLGGKVLGLGLMSLGQVALVIFSGLAAALLIGDIDLPAGTAQTAILALLFFVLGYGLYGCAFAVAGSLVSRQEDAQSSTAPVMLILVAGYILSIQVISDPASTLASVCTFIPPIAPLIVPARAAAGELPLDQLLISVALMVLSCIALIWLAGRVYERTVLRLGVPIRYRELPGLIGRR